MPIQSGDVKLLRSSVMADVPEGGGAPSALTVPDGVSNAIFPDISELDRAGGRVNLRKTFISIQTDDTDLYFGANVIVADPPDDPRVSVTLFSNGSVFDTRTEAQSRIESYLNKGPEWAGFLYENHIRGQRVIQLFQRPGSELPSVGQTLVLIQNEGTGTEREQYVRATDVGFVQQTFTISTGSGFLDYHAWIVTVNISDALRHDFTGTPANRLFQRDTAGTRVRDTVVADAGTYVGVVPLAAAASLGDFTLRGTSMFTQLVPSAQTETPISDLRTNGLSAALVGTGEAETVNLDLAFTSTQALHVGGPILPGSLRVVRAGVTLTDSGGLLMNSGQEVGQVDYEAGIVRLSQNVFGTSGGAHAVTFQPATVPDLISDQRAIRVTAESRSLSYVFTMGNIPLRRTLSVSYLAQGRWYVLREDGSGAIRGIDSAFGTGTLNFSTGAVVLTLGALPDVGSVIVIQSFSEVTTVRPSNTTMINGGRVYVPLNTSGQMSEERGARPIVIGSLIVRWNDGTARTANDDGLGNLSGAATGTVDYSAGVVRLSPNVLPPPGTVFLLDSNGAASQQSTPVPVAGGSLGATNVAPGSVSIAVQLTFQYSTSMHLGRVAFTSRQTSAVVQDNGAGGLRFQDPGNGAWVNCGSVNYAAGTFTLTAMPGVSSLDIAGPLVTWGPNSVVTSWNTLDPSTRARNVVISGPGGSAEVTVRHSSTSPGLDSVSILVNQFAARVLMVPNFTLRGASFTLGTTRYLQLTDNTLVRDPSPLNGGGTPSGSVSGPMGVVFLSHWPTGASPELLNWRGLIAPPSVGPQAPFAGTATIFRTASAPIRPGSLSVLGTMQDGTTFNVVAGIDGKINGARVKGRVDYQFGFVELYFVNPDGNVANNVDLAFLQIPGLASTPADLAMLNSLRYSAVAFSFLPLDAALLGIDPVRLPTDGRVPIFRPGGFAVVGHTGQITATVANGQTINCGRVRLSRVRVLGHNGAVIHTGFSADLEAGTVTFANVTGYSQPVTIEHRVEDMGVVRDANINGEITFTRPVTHNYPLGSHISSALVAGDLFARVPLAFDQASWNGVFSDTPGTAATATYNRSTYPIAVTNRGAITERWAIRFTSSLGFEVIGENVGVIGTGNTNAVCAPINPNTGAPYFSIDPLGWGAGWATGNVMRLNTIGAMFPVWVVRTVQQGPETVTRDSFTLLVRGDVDTP